MSTITRQEDQASLADLIDNLQPGEERFSTKDNRPLAKIIGQLPNASQRPGPGLCKGMIIINTDEKEHLQDFAEYMP